MTLRKEVPTSIKALIVLIFLIGFASFVFVIVDSGWTHFVIATTKIADANKKSSGMKPQNGPQLGQQPVQPPENPTQSNAVPNTSVSPTANNQTPSFFDSVRKSIVLVVAKINDRESSFGTGFVVKSGYIATNAHVVANSSNITLVDYQGNRYPATPKGIGTVKQSGKDLAILRYNEVQDRLPALSLAELSEGKANEKIQTVGYPLTALESGQNAPVPSSEGVIQSYNAAEKLFYSQGMILNQGNSGGPVFLLSSRKALGMAVAKTTDRLTSEGVAIFIPSDSIRSFFKTCTGETLP